LLGKSYPFSVNSISGFNKLVNILTIPIAILQKPWNSRDMAKKKGYTPEQSHMIIFGAILAVLAVILFVYERNMQSAPLTPKTTAVSPTLSPQTSLLVDAAVWYPSAPWTSPAPTSQTTYYGTLKGQAIKATVEAPNPMLEHFEMPEMLKEKGFLPDNNLSADGPGSSTWGYKKTTNGEIQLMTFSYKTQPSNTNPNEPLQFNCPCKMNVEVFVSDPASEKE
jgi:hypothetical protein